MRIHFQGSKVMDVFSSNKRIRYYGIAFVACLTVYIMYKLVNYGTPTLFCSCDYICDWRGKTDAKRNIFLIETTGRENLTARQLCAIESAAKYNYRDFNVIVYLKNMEMKPVLSRLRDTYNVTYVELNVDKMFKGTVVQDLIQSGKIQNSTYIVHMSDLVRLMLLWQYGGIYLDMDVIVLKSLSKLVNFTVLETNLVAANGVMGFTPNHPVMEIALNSFAKKYDAKAFAANGPYLITAAIREFCQEESLEYINVLECGVHLYPRRIAYEIYYTERQKFFVNDTNSVENSLQRIRKSLLTHLWNYLTAKTIVKVGDNTLLEILIKEHCPIVYDDILTRNIQEL